MCLMYILEYCNEYHSEYEKSAIYGLEVNIWFHRRKLKLQINKNTTTQPKVHGIAVFFVHLTLFKPNMIFISEKKCHAAFNNVYRNNHL